MLKWKHEKNHDDIVFGKDYVVMVESVERIQLISRNET